MSFHLPFTLAAPTRAFVTLAGAAIVLFYTFAIAQRAIHTVQLRQEAAALETQRRGLEVRSTTLEEERRRLQDGTDVETIARRELNLIKEGETAVVVLPSQTAVERSKLPSPPADAPRPPLWEVLWKGLFGG